VVALLSAGCLTLIALIGHQASPAMMQLVLAGTLGLILLALILQRMELGLTVLVVAGGTAGFSIGTGTHSAINLAMILVSLLAGVWVLRMAAVRRLRLVPSGLNLPLLAFLGSAVLSWIAASVAAGHSVRLPGNILTVQAGQFAIYALSAAAFFLGANHPLGQRTLKVWTGFIVVIGTAIMGWDVAVGWKHAVGMWNGSLYMWPVVLLVAQGLFNPRLASRWWVLAGGAVGFWAVWVARACVSFKGGWVPALLALCLLLLLKSRRLMLVCLLIAGLIVVAIGPATVWSAVVENEGATANPVRAALWLDVFRMGLRSPVFGLGLVAYSSYWGAPSLESVSYEYVSPYAYGQRQYAPPAHNMYADVFAQMGSLGLALLLWVLAAGICLGFRATRQAPVGFSRAYAYAVLCGFASMAVSSFFFADWLLPYVYNVGLKGFPQTAYTWLFLGTLVPLAAARGGDEAQS
jgi:hypothetical protein